MNMIVRIFLSALFCLSLAVHSGQWNLPLDVYANTIEESRKEKLDWSYKGNIGPEYWGELDPSFSACKFGRQQSPINIDPSKVNKKVKDRNIRINYRDTSINLINSGHTIQGNVKESNNRIIFDGQAYRLVQFHFHTPSEHTWNEKSDSMELHLVHEAENGEVAVLGVMIREGMENSTLAPIWNVLPKKKTEDGGVVVKEPINLQELLPTDQTVYFYRGSLTTPPCTENVNWLLYEKPIEMSPRQIQEFRTLFPDNHRPIQPLNNRDIILFKVTKN